MPLPVRPSAYTCARCLLLSNARRPFSVSPVARVAPRRTQDFNSGFTSSYDPSTETGRGPMFNKNKFGVPQFYPRDLKKRVDDYVVGQDRAKKTICSTIFNHYQGVRRRTNQDHEERVQREKAERQRYARDRDLPERRDVHPVQGQRSRYSPFQRYRADEEWPQDEFPGHAESVQHMDEGYSSPTGFDGSYLVEEPTTPPQVKIDKSNLLLIGPTGVGKTYILETLSKKLNVPFTIADCNSFTQAGYIGQDVETCIERLLIEANYDIKATEHGIVVLDEFDKLAKRDSMNGRDVGGEGVQQALLKLVEGSKVTVNVKDNRSSRSASPITTNYTSSSSTSAPQSTPPQGKVDQYTIDTTNILFVFCGAFVGLDKVVVRRVSKPSMGFGSELRASQGLGNTHAIPRQLFSHLPHVDAEAPASAYTPLDLTTPVDLQAFGFIPELIGRVHNICALSPLSLDDLFRILTEPRNSLVAQYTALFETYPSRLHFTRKALYAIAERAAKSETGARGLKMEMERVLAEPIFDAPMPYVLITEACVKGSQKADYWGKDGRLEVERRIAEEDSDNAPHTPEATFEQYREAGQSGA
ncbi:ATP-dependent clpX-like chaperone [Colletotrichum siamense]|uniref:ATP-dependent clpX-like chaperone n=1 Tax=Colletotrichum siamense TaxID=690259 RepID=A0A9P5EKU8_COLSI|nr:ATP-dependent clpX-like chaperone [Colletotrichum siamense]KAF4852331.1 ATP-dependent clpX-like chaperone [Colletotrichum siamense]